MMTCRELPNESWEQARKALIFYFSRRHLRDDAEDLAQQTLTEIWKREDYKFRSSEDFLKVCYGFGVNILRSARRTQKKHIADELDAEISDGAGMVMGLNPAEAAVLLRETNDAKAKLSPADREAIEMDAAGISPEDKKKASHLRVRFFRAKERLKKSLHGGKV
jgi:DNA-directed RNA polymerase specialized sigma24 family protein